MKRKKVEELPLPVPVDPPLQKFTFTNLTITVRAVDSKSAYERVMYALKKLEAEWVCDNVTLAVYQPESTQSEAA